MDVTTAMLTRRSEHDLLDPAPDDNEFTYLLKVAAAAPDHGLLHPWRWVLVRGDDRDALGACFAEDVREERRARAVAKVQRAPLLASLVFAPVRGHKVPQWEQLAATSAMTHALMLLLHSRGFGSIWRTGALVHSPQARRLLDLADGEELLGWLYIGTPDPSAPRRRRELYDVSGRLTKLSALTRASSPARSRSGASADCPTGM
ncbi:nitroreductase family protein [Streptomyces rhizosphaericus]|uniref:Putative NAD(P)H nitroreductase n=1 Tax=Streptomyces rhizosphaericus TaxID=114699 RepID=A0A6G4AW69_9ACTN|nr:nitroreductase [Streptomyces rhizosphaericus]NEW77726.1 nitroreductase [Streptomyces rhizosphaericus]